MMQIIPMTDKEKLKMYMKQPKKKLAEMLIECNKALSRKPISYSSYQTTPEQQVDAIKKATKEVLKSKESCRQFLVDAGII